MKKIVCAIVGVVLLCVLIVSVIGGNDEGTPDNPPPAPVTQERVLIDNEVVKVSFVEVFEEPSISNTCYLRLKVENKTDKTVTIYLKDVYVNDMVVMVGSGVPMTIVSGKTSQTPFFFTYTNLDITSISEIETIELKVWVVDESFDAILETDSLTIDIK